MEMQKIAGATPAPADALFREWRGRLPLESRRSDLVDALHSQHPELAQAVAEVPFERFEAAFPFETVQRYTDVPAEAGALVATIPKTLRTPWLHALLLWHIGRFEACFPATGLADEFALHYADGFQRIMDQIEKKPDFADLASDSFMKDLWLARLVMIPAFAQIWWPRAGLSASTIVRRGLRPTAYVALRCGGRRPFMEGHTHDPMARAYWNAAGWGEALRLAALALPSLPHVRGAFGSAWFYDPAIQQVSPRITFAQDLQVGQGAIRLRIGSNDAAIANATATSASRRRLMAEGSYLPTDYAIIWSRRDLIARYG